ncbi:Maf family nucleotide pyrophosphatase [Aquiflexum sp. TKW24L]|uniref:Maf family nucleotide pyrophosphatase n=1 Tax=Aquiflexum sp. TKW24L TaxID=2942212 RepID=UPI0020BF3A45|nr:Maf family nucleotide pyrophosphatase [Aquiflexum sp. TKW24L]MCL6259991.1 Maf family nucleotide pyrophosphatase [Aquiflexum sp. TKW24L]
MIDLGTYKLILASQSPRRKELLKGLGIEFEVRIKDIKEDFPTDLHPSDVAGYLSAKKAVAFQEEIEPSQIVLTSDTVVILDGKILGKPVDEADAFNMLYALSGKSHLVSTGITFLSKEKTLTLSDTAKVFFKELSNTEIDYYISNFRPFDKAGAYGIQEWIGFVGVEKIEGSYFTVMGLPIHLVYDVLKNW